MRLRGLFLLMFAACGAPSAPAPRSEPVPSTRVAPPSIPEAKSPVKAAATAETKSKLSLPEARRYMLALINKDRATQHLAPVELDEGPPGIAGQAHADDMARNGYLGHWGTDGSVPEQRASEAGGSDMVLENALCFTDEATRKLDAQPIIDAAAIEKSESMFFNEVPPNDGHRRNILRPLHKRVGIGIAQPVATATELPVPCVSQEFTDPYGTYAPLPKQMRVGSTLHVEGSVAAPATVGGVGLARVDAPKPIKVAELNTRRSYLVPAPYQMYWPAGFATPIPLVVDGHHFAIDVPLSDKGKRGMYEVSIWAKLPGTPEYVMVSLRTVRVD